eukprot:TRINITY_DN3540_c0_g2_i1.p1 TRINITY_DN3540_c0_g2~~TRINITY_DN3540_c0_g2_i1.p1  ORF type:complete len:211 (+),score=68.45 TRINITY_DN3540_c0_g2_i1:57-689(+)
MAWRRVGVSCAGGVFGGLGMCGTTWAHAADAPPATNPYYHHQAAPSAPSAPGPDGDEAAALRQIAKEVVAQIHAEMKRGKAAVDETKRKAQKELHEAKDEHLVTLRNKVMDEITRMLRSDPALKYVLDSYKQKVAEHIQQEADRELARVIDNTAMVKAVKARADSAIEASQKRLEAEYNSYTSAMLRWTFGGGALAGCAVAAACLVRPKM